MKHLWKIVYEFGEKRFRTFQVWRARLKNIKHQGEEKNKEESRNGRSNIDQFLFFFNKDLVIFNSHGQFG